MESEFTIANKCSTDGRLIIFLWRQKIQRRALEEMAKVHWSQSEKSKSNTNVPLASEKVSFCLCPPPPPNDENGLKSDHRKNASRRQKSKPVEQIVGSSHQYTDNLCSKFHRQRVIKTSRESHGIIGHLQEPIVGVKCFLSFFLTPLKL